jgi:hypothetical protein
MVVFKNTRENRERGAEDEKETMNRKRRSTAKAIEGPSLSFQGIDDIHGSHGLPAGVLCVGDSISDDILEEDLENATGLFVDEAADTLNAASAGEATDCRFGDSLDVVTEDLAMALGASLTEAFAAFTASGHGDGGGARSPRNRNLSSDSAPASSVSSDSDPASSATSVSAPASSVSSVSVSVSASSSSSSSSFEVFETLICDFAYI